LWFFNYVYNQSLVNELKREGYFHKYNLEFYFNDLEE
jgi:hypothetical protein